MFQTRYISLSWSCYSSFKSRLSQIPSFSFTALDTIFDVENKNLQFLNSILSYSIAFSIFLLSNLTCANWTPIFPLKPTGEIFPSFPIVKPQMLGYPLCLSFSHIPHPWANPICSTFKIYLELGYFYNYHSGPYLLPELLVSSLVYLLPPLPSYHLFSIEQCC